MIQSHRRCRRQDLITFPFDRLRFCDNLVDHGRRMTNCIDKVKAIRRISRHKSFCDVDLHKIRQCASMLGIKRQSIWSKKQRFWLTQASNQFQNFRLHWTWPRNRQQSVDSSLPINGARLISLRDAIQIVSVNQFIPEPYDAVEREKTANKDQTNQNSNRHICIADAIGNRNAIGDRVPLNRDRKHDRKSSGFGFWVCRDFCDLAASAKHMGTIGDGDGC